LTGSGFGGLVIWIVESKSWRCHQDHFSSQLCTDLIGSNDPRQKHWSRQDAATEEAKTEQWRSRGLFV
jgi:hypothetical protein